LRLAKTGTGANEVQTLTFGGTITGGAFTITMALATGPLTSQPIAWSSTPATLLANIQAAVTSVISGVSGATATVVNTNPTGTGPFTITFGGALAGTNLAQMTVASSLSGTGASVSAGTSTEGGRDAIAGGTI